MGTRAIIGTANDGGFTGRYTHWDGYPTHHGPVLQQAYAELGQDWEAVKRYAIREEAGAIGYWSSFLAPSEAAAQDAKPAKIVCRGCNGTGVRADGQFQERGPNCNYCSSTGQQNNPDRCDHWRADNGEGWVTHKDDCGAEWAYLLDAKGITVLASVIAETGEKAIGMFGGLWTEFGWQRVGFAAWGEEVDWERVECGENFELCHHYAWAHFPEAEGTTIGTRDWLAGVRA